MNIAIVRAFIALRQTLIKHHDSEEQLKVIRHEVFDRIGEHDVQLSPIYDAIESLLDSQFEKTEEAVSEQRERIGFKKTPV